MDKPDPRFTQSKRAKSSFRLAIRISLIVIGVLDSFKILETDSATVRHTPHKIG